MFLMRLLAIFISLLVSSLVYSSPVVIDMAKVGDTFVMSSVSNSAPVALRAASQIGAFAARWSPVVAIGTVVLELAFTDHFGARINFIPSDNLAPTPQGWSGPNSPPSSSSLGFRASDGVVYRSQDEACGRFPVPFGYSACHAGNTPSSCLTTRLSSPYNEASCGNVTVTCFQGYSLVAGECVLSEPATGKNSTNVAQWPPDSVPTLKFKDGTFQPALRDPDNLPAIPNGPSAGGQGFKGPSGQDPVGNPSQQEGDIKVPYFTFRKRQQGVDSTGVPAVQVSSITVNVDGRVVSVTDQYQYNTDLPQSIAGSGGQTIDTSDLAKQATLQEINDKLKPDIQSEYPKLDDTPTFEDTTNKFVSDIKSAMPVLDSFDDGGAGCPVFSRYVPYLNVNLEITQLCDLDPYIRPPIQVVMNFVWFFLAVRIFLSA